MKISVVVVCFLQLQTVNGVNIHYNLISYTGRILFGTQILMTSWVGFVVLGCGHIGDLETNASIFKMFYSILGYNATHCQ